MSLFVQCTNSRGTSTGSKRTGASKADTGMGERRWPWTADSGGGNRPSTALAQPVGDDRRDEAAVGVPGHHHGAVRERGDHRPGVRGRRLAGREVEVRREDVVVGSAQPAGHVAPCPRPGAGHMHQREHHPLHETSFNVQTALRQYARPMPALAVTDLRKRYKRIEALRGVSLEVGEGELFGLLGPNGAGKSTLVKIACGLVRPTAGRAEVAGAPAGSLTAQRALGYLAELFRFPEWQSADEVLDLHQRLADSPGGAAERAELLDLVGLAEAAQRPVGQMSKGMQQRLGIAQAMVGSPRLLLLDEPTSALDPAGRRTVRRLLEELRSRGVAVLLNSHLLSE